MAALDIGTTTIRCIIFDEQLRVQGSAHDEVQLIYPQPGHVEIDAEDFWRRICSTIQRSIRDAQLQPQQIECLGISTQRSTFITWDAVTGRPYHNFITWKDLRADSLVKKWNSSLLLKVSMNWSERDRRLNIATATLINYTYEYHATNKRQTTLPFLRPTDRFISTIHLLSHSHFSPFPMSLPHRASMPSPGHCTQ